MKNVNPRLILFEPWNLGDAVIAFATALQDPERIALACSSRWHNILRCAASGMAVPTLIPVDLGYVMRNKQKKPQQALPKHLVGDATVLSIRGDIRDYRAARTLFPDSKIRMNGWVPFLAKRFAVVDYGFARGWFPVRNRYKAWAELADVGWERIENFYGRQRASNVPSIAIHVGATWRSKQFPQVAELVRSLQDTCEVRIIAGPGDPLPEGVFESDVSRLVDTDLVNALASSTHVVANDSGPMHLAALLRCRTFVIYNASAMWLPPATVSIEPSSPVRGYKSRSLSDEVLSGWPSTQQVVSSLRLCHPHRFVQTASGRNGK
ncbi:MAG: glycosyltransferase family 9 protein [Acidobacteriaceae bacterium]